MTEDTKLVLQQLKAQGLLTEALLKQMFGEEIPQEVREFISAAS